MLLTMHTMAMPDSLLFSCIFCSKLHYFHAQFLQNIHPVLRWMNLALILVLRSISSAVKQRFPTLEHVVEAGNSTGVQYMCTGVQYRCTGVQFPTLEHVVEAGNSPQLSSP